MIERFSELKKDLTELATVLNQFKSEAVQLRLLELLFDAAPERDIEGKGKAISAKRHVKRPAKRSAEKSHSESITVGGTKEKPKRAASGQGAPAALTNLLASDFFKTHKTIGDIISHAKNNMARSFKANEFSGKLARLVRSGELTRKKNADGQYEYKKL